MNGDEDEGGDEGASVPRGDDLRDLVRLTMVAGVGPHTGRALLDRFGAATRVLDAPTSALRDVPNVGPKVAARIAGARRECDAEAELALCERSGVSVVAG